MTPEQEERLGQMMREDARKSGQTKKVPPDGNRAGAATQDKIDADICILILRYLKATDERIHRIQIIKELDVGSGTIDRCLRKLAKAGKAKRIQNRYSTYWEAVEWPAIHPNLE